MIKTLKKTLKTILLLGSLFIIGCTNKVYTVSFNSNGGTEVSKVSAKTLDESLKPNDPSKLGYTFTGWFKDEEFTQKATFTETLKTNITFHAKWEVNKYTISFISNGGSLVDPITKDFNSKVVKPDNPIKEGYSFSGWFSDFELKEVYDFSVMPAINISLYAKWSINSYTINFESNGGSLVSPITSNYDDIIIAPTAPTKDKEIFLGWYIDQELLNEFIFTTMPSKNLTLYAKWEDDPEGFIYEEIEEGLIVLGYSGDNLNVVVPKTFKGKTVIGIGENAFASRSDIKSIYIPETITLISIRAFYRNTSLETINFAENSNLLFIGNEAFKDAKALLSIVIPNSVLNIGKEAFYNASALNEVVFEEGSKLTNISESMFYSATSLTSITLPSGIVSISDNAFIYTEKLNYVYIPNTVISIGRNAFYEATGLEVVEFEENSKLETIGWYAFLNTNKLTSIFIPKTVTSMGNFVFYFCGKLTIYAEAESKPEGWETDWNRSNRPVVWGSTQN